MEKETLRVGGRGILQVGVVGIVPTLYRSLGMSELAPHSAALYSIFFCLAQPGLRDGAREGYVAVVVLCHNSRFFFLLQTSRIQMQQQQQFFQGYHIINLCNKMTHGRSSSTISGISSVICQEVHFSFSPLRRTFETIMAYRINPVDLR